MEGKRVKPVGSESVRVEQKEEAEKLGGDGDAIAIGGVSEGVRVWKKKKWKKGKKKKSDKEKRKSKNKRFSFPQKYECVKYSLLCSGAGTGTHRSLSFRFITHF